MVQFCKNFGIMIEIGVLKEKYCNLGICKENVESEEKTRPRIKM
jgi:hypothetical protein